MRRLLAWTVIALVSTTGTQAAAAEPAAPEPPPKQLGVGSGGYFQPGLLLQAWFLSDRTPGEASTFRLRRAELHLKGQLVPGRVAYGLMIDPAKVLEFKDTSLLVRVPADPQNPGTVEVKQPVGSVSVLQDAFITVISPYVDVTVGQFKTPVSWEGYNSSSKLLFPERALVSRAFGDRRDLGLRVAKTFRLGGYSAGVFNGSGLNRLDTNDDKDVALRLEGYPVEGLVVAALAYLSVGERRSVRDRYEADVRFERGPFLFQAEYIRALDGGADAPRIEAQGFYGALAYTFLDVLQPAVRVGYLDPDTRLNLDPASAGGRDEVWHVDAGLNYYLRGHSAKLQLAFGRLQFETLAPRTQLTLAGQVSF